MQAEWRNGRRKGLKIPCPVRDVRVRVPPRPLEFSRFSRFEGRATDPLAEGMFTKMFTKHEPPTGANGGLQGGTSWQILSTC